MGGGCLLAGEVTGERLGVEVLRSSIPVAVWQAASSRLGSVGCSKARAPVLSRLTSWEQLGIPDDSSWLAGLLAGWEELGPNI